MLDLKHGEKGLLEVARERYIYRERESAPIQIGTKKNRTMLDLKHGEKGLLEVSKELRGALTKVVGTKDGIDRGHDHQDQEGVAHGYDGG